MATMRNPINRNTTIDLNPTLETIDPSYGQYADSGLFEEQGITSGSIMYKVDKQEAPKMTKLTSRTERDAMATDKVKHNLVTMGQISLKETGGVHVEDMIGVTNGLFEETSPSFQEATVKELTKLANVAAANREYLLTTATQGVVLDPYDGAEAINQYSNTGTPRVAVTIDASPASSITASLNTLSNTIADLNGYNGNVGTVEVVLGEEAFNNIVSHPDFAALYQLAFSGLGQQALAQPLLNGTAGRRKRNQYGYRREFSWDNFLFVTYPQKFRRWNGDSVDIIETNKGWTIVDVAGLYQVKYCPAPYLSTFQSAGTRWTARSTGIVNDTHADITLESHMIPYMVRPEMALDITVVA
jgi:hypothetical protein